MWRVLQCKNKQVSCYWSKLASVIGAAAQRGVMGDRPISDVRCETEATCDRQSEHDKTVDDVTADESALSPATITPVRKRARTSDCLHLPNRKSARLAVKNT